MYYITAIARILPIDLLILIVIWGLIHCVVLI